MKKRVYCNHKFFKQVIILIFFRYADMDGSNRHIVLEGVPHPFSISLFEDFMYWTDWNHLTVERANKYTGANHTILWNVTHRPMDVHVFHPLKQRQSKLYCCINNNPKLSITHSGFRIHSYWSKCLWKENQILLTNHNPYSR